MVVRSRDKTEEAVARAGDKRGAGVVRAVFCGHYFCSSPPWFHCLVPAVFPGSSCCDFSYCMGWHYSSIYQLSTLGYEILFTALLFCYFLGSGDLTIIGQCCQKAEILATNLTLRR